jgi:hypothetical protein
MTVGAAAAGLEAADRFTQIGAEPEHVRAELLREMAARLGLAPGGFVVDEANDVLEAVEAEIRIIALAGERLRHPVGGLDRIAHDRGPKRIGRGALDWNRVRRLRDCRARECRETSIKDHTKHARNYVCFPFGFSASAIALTRSSLGGPRARQFFPRRFPADDFPSARSPAPRFPAPAGTADRYTAA